MKPLFSVRKNLQELYSYPETLSGREAYKTAWHLARLTEYQRPILSRSKAQTRQHLVKACAAFGVPDDLAKLARIHLLQRNRGL